MIHPVDKHVGTKIRNLRRLSGISQKELAQAVGIKFQQIQKYETGANRVSASRLWDISQALSAPVVYFFENVETDAGHTKSVDDHTKLFNNPEAIKLVRKYFEIPEVQRRSILSLTCALASDPDEKDGPTEQAHAA